MGSKLKIKQGTTYGKLTVLCEGITIRTPSGQTNRTLRCRCECGKTKDIRISHLTRGLTKSCGCISRKLGGESNTVIGKLYHGIKSRCSKSHSERHLYFDKGISMCDEWSENFDLFKKWCKNNGHKKGLHIDRINGEKGYSPDNCRFVTPQVNANNKFNTYYVFYKNKNWPLKLLLKHLGQPNKYHTVYSRLKRNWSLEDAIFKSPKNNYKNRLDYKKKLKELE